MLQEDNNIYIYNPYRVIRMSHVVYAADDVGSTKKWLPTLRQLSTLSVNNEGVFYYPDSKMIDVGIITNTAKTINKLYNLEYYSIATDTGVSRIKHNDTARYIYSRNNVISVNNDIHDAIIKTINDTGRGCNIYAGRTNDPVKYIAGPAALVSFVSLPFIADPADYMVGLISNHFSVNVNKEA